jgi:hypothetical protein
MYLNYYFDIGLRALSAVAIVLALGYVFDHGHTTTLAALLHPLLGL